MQLPTQFADVVDPQRTDGSSCNGNFLAAQPAEGLVVQGRIRQPGKDVSRARTGQHQYAPFVGDVGNPHLFAGAHALDQVVQVTQFGAGRGQYIEMVIGKMRDRHLAADSAAFGQHVREGDAAVFRYPVGADTIQERTGAAPVTSYLAKPDKSRMPTRSRTARHSSRTTSKTLLRR